MAPGNRRHAHEQGSQDRGAFMGTNPWHRKSFMRRTLPGELQLQDLGDGVSRAQALAMSRIPTQLANRRCSEQVELSGFHGEVDDLITRRRQSALSN